MALEINKTEREPGRWYMYLFVRQDMDPVHQLVQASHIGFRAGHFIRGEQDYFNKREAGQHFAATALGIDLESHLKDGKEDVDLDNIYFRVIGIEDGEELLKLSWTLLHNKVMTVSFREPDFNNEVTGIATWPVKHGSPQCDYLYNNYNAKLLQLP